MTFNTTPWEGGAHAKKIDISTILEIGAIIIYIIILIIILIRIKCKPGKLPKNFFFQVDIDPQEFLDAFDSNHFFRKTGGLISTGPAKTNVMDLIVMIIE